MCECSPRTNCSHIASPKHFTEGYYRGLYVGASIGEKGNLPPWDHLQELFVQDSCADILALPGLPSLRILTVDFYRGILKSPPNHCNLVAVHLQKLPKLSRLNIGFLEADNLILLGKSRSLKYLSLICSDIEERFRSSLMSLTPQIETFEAKDSTIKLSGNSNTIPSQLKSIDLDDSISYLAFFFSETIPDSLETATLTTGEEDKRQMQQAGLDLSLLPPEGSDSIKITQREASVATIRQFVQALRIQQSF